MRHYHEENENDNCNCDDCFVYSGGTLCPLDCGSRQIETLEKNKYKCPACLCIFIIAEEGSIILRDALGDFYTIIGGKLTSVPEEFYSLEEKLDDLVVTPAETEMRDDSHLSKTMDAQDQLKEMQLTR